MLCSMQDMLPSAQIQAACRTQEKRSQHLKAPISSSQSEDMAIASYRVFIAVNCRLRPALARYASRRTASTSRRGTWKKICDLQLLKSPGLAPLLATDSLLSVITNVA